MMSKGSSEPWQNVLNELSEGRVRNLDSNSMMQYFKPLHELLLKQNLTDTEWNCDDYLDQYTGEVKSYSSVNYNQKLRNSILNQGNQIDDSDDINSNSEILKSSYLMFFLIAIIYFCK